MKFLIIINSLGAGGAEASTEIFCDYLNGKGEAFEILCLDRKEVGVQDRMIAKGYKVTFITKGNFISETIQISKFIKQGKFNLVHSVLFEANLRTRFAKLLTSFIHIESLVNTTYSKERFMDDKVNKLALKIYYFIDKLTARLWVDHFHSITETVKEHYCQKLGIKPQKVTIIFRGRKPLISSRAYKKYTVDRPLELINVGRHEFQKGQIYLLKAIKELKELNYKIKLTVLGRNGNETSKLIHYIEANQLQNEVILESYKDTVQDYLLAADVFVFPSLYEGLGGALIEAQSAGLPMVCNDIPVFHEVVNANENAILTDVYDSSKLVEAIVFFIKNPDMIQQYGEKSLENFKEKFELNANNEKMYQLYLSLCLK